MLSSSDFTTTDLAHFIDALFQDTFLFVMEVLHDTQLVRDEAFYRRGYELVAQVKSALETLKESDEFKMQVMYAQCGLLDYTVLNSAPADENTVLRQAPLEGAHLATLRAGEINLENLRQPAPELPLSSPVIDEFVRQQGTEISSGGKPVTIGDSRYGCVYTVKTDLSTIPDEFRYRFSNRILRVTLEGVTTAAYQAIAKQVKAPRERLRLALGSGLQVTALDGMFWFGMQRIAADIATLRASGMKIATDRIDVSDNLTGTTRRIPVYKLAD